MLEVVGASGIVLVVDVDSSVTDELDVDSLVELDEVEEPSAAVSSTSCGFPTAGRKSGNPETVERLYSSCHEKSGPRRGSLRNLLYSKFT